MKKPNINFPPEEKKVEKVKFVRPAGMKTPERVVIPDALKQKVKKEVLALSKKGGGMMKTADGEISVFPGLEGSVLNMVVEDVARGRMKAKK
jgi:hypothetical protein